MRAALGTLLAASEDEREEAKQGWQRSIRFHLREQLKREGIPLLRIDRRTEEGQEA